MRAPISMLLLLLAACRSDGPARPGGLRLPETLARLDLAEDSLEITPVEFPHDLHMDPAAMGGPVSCRRCHHDTSGTPASLPARCGDCHPMEPAEGKPPDL